MSALHNPEMFADRACAWAPGMARGAFPALVPPTWVEAKPLRLVNLSPSGFIARDDGGLEVGEMVSLDLPGIGAICAHIVRRDRGRIHGRFMHSGCLRLLFVNGLQRSGDIWQVSATRAV